MAQTSSVEFDHCRELAMRPGSLFEFTSRFIPRSQFNPLLALYALRQTVRSIPVSPIDDSVKWAKLKWWSEEFEADPASPSRHPVMRALWLSGARERLTQQLLQQLINDAVMQIDTPPDSDINAMFERLAQLGRTEIQLELALDNAEIGHQTLNHLAAATRLHGMISGYAVIQGAEREPLPLSLLAKYDLDSARLDYKPRPAGLSRAVTELAGLALQWYGEGMAGNKIPVRSGECMHLQLRCAMEKRQLTRISKDADVFLEPGNRYRPSDAWFAWRYLRQLK